MWDIENIWENVRWYEYAQSGCLAGWRLYKIAEYSGIMD